MTDVKISNYLIKKVRIQAFVMAGIPGEVRLHAIGRTFSL